MQKSEFASGFTRAMSAAAAAHCTVGTATPSTRLKTGRLSFFVQHSQVLALSGCADCCNHRGDIRARNEGSRRFHNHGEGPY